MTEQEAEFFYRQYLEPRIRFGEDLKALARSVGRKKLTEVYNALYKFPLGNLTGIKTLNLIRKHFESVDKEVALRRGL